MGEYFYKEQDVTSCILIQTEKAVRILAKKFDTDFDSMLEKFYNSKTYANLINPETTLWAESAEFIADDFCMIG